MHKSTVVSILYLYYSNFRIKSAFPSVRLSVYSSVRQSFRSFVRPSVCLLHLVILCWQRLSIFFIVDICIPFGKYSYYQVTLRLWDFWPSPWPRDCRLLKPRERHFKDTSWLFDQIYADCCLLHRQMHRFFTKHRNNVWNFVVWDYAL